MTRRKIFLAVLLALALTACSSGHRSDRHLRGASGSAATSWSGSYIGAYSSSVDSGLIGIRVRADDTFEAMAASSLDPSVTEYASGVVAPDGALLVAQVAGGTQINVSLATLAGSYQTPVDSGTITLTPIDPALVEGVYAGDFTGTTTSARILTLVDSQQVVHSVVWDPARQFLSGDAIGGIVPSGPDWNLTALNLADGMVIGGTISGSTVSGTWSSSFLGDAGSWDGDKRP